MKNTLTSIGWGWPMEVVVLIPLTAPDQSLSPLHGSSSLWIDRARQRIRRSQPARGLAREVDNGGDWGSLLCEVGYTYDALLLLVAPLGKGVPKMMTVGHLCCVGRDCQYKIYNVSRVTFKVGVTNLTYMCNNI
jgi:hypothetical protein